MQDYYSILGINSESTREEIRSAYKKLAKLHHPDRGGDTAKFQEIQNAYSVLNNPETRQQYDLRNQSGILYGDYGDLHSRFDDIIISRHTRTRLSAVKIPLWIDLEDIAAKSPKVISIKTGDFSHERSQYVEIEIPEAVEDGSSFRYTKLIKTSGGERDLVVTFKINPSNRWQRDGLDITTAIDIKIWDLITGTPVTVNTIKGNKMKLTIPAGTQPNTVMRLAEHGLEDCDNKRGDMYVKLNAYIPETIPYPLLQTIQFYKDQPN